VVSRSVVEGLNAAWNSAWPQTPPIAFLLRTFHPERWIRFHSLPESKRYAETEAERAEILRRHHAVLDALGPDSEYFVISTRFDSETPSDVTPPNGLHWQTIEPNDYFDEPTHLYVDSIDSRSAEFDELLRAAADWQIANIIIGPHDLRWLYHPYDGGADVIAPTTSRRDQLRANFKTWLSPHPEGL